jgi:hypothetical protein
MSVNLLNFIEKVIYAGLVAQMLLINKMWQVPINEESISRIF